MNANNRVVKGVVFRAAGVVGDKQAYPPWVGLFFPYERTVALSVHGTGKTPSINSDATFVRARLSGRKEALLGISGGIKRKNRPR